MKRMVVFVASAVGLALFFGAAAQAASFSYKPHMILEKDALKPQVVRFALGGGRLVVGYYGGAVKEGVIKIWDMYEKKAVKELPGHKMRVSALAISPSGRYLASGGWAGHVVVHNLMAEKEALDLKAHKGQVNTLAFSPDGMTLAAGGKDKKVTLWDMETGTLLGELKGHTKAVKAVAFTPDGKVLVTCSEDKTIRSWDVVARTEKRSIEESAAKYGKLTHCSISPDGFMVAAAIKEVKAAIKGRRRAKGGIKEIDFIGLRDFKTGEVQGRLEGHLETINALDYSPDGRYVASASDDHSVMIWDVVEKARVTVIDLKESALSVDFSSDGKYLAACDEKGGLYVYRLSGVSAFPRVVAGGREYKPPEVELAAYEGQPRRIAVMEFKSKGKVEDYVGSILSDSLRNFLQQTGRYEVVDRQHMKAMLKEMKMQLSGIVDEETAVAMGKMLGAKGLVFGSVAKLGNMWAINMQMTSVETGRVLATAEERCACAEEDLFLAISTAASRLIMQ